MTDWLMANPHAGDGDRGGPFWKDCLEKAGIRDLRLCDLDEQSWIRTLSADDRVLVAGGDGSVNLAAAFCVERGATLAVLPSGTANDFFRNLGLADDPQTLCRSIAEGHTRELDVAMAGDTLFLNVAHVGLGTAPVTEQESSQKKLFGRFSYGLTFLRRVSEKRGFHGVIATESGQVGGRWLSIAIANGAYFGGGNEVPGASLDNGQLVIVGVRPRPLWRLALAFFMTRMGRPPRDNQVIVRLQGTRCRLTTAKPKTITLDGEVADKKTPLEVICKAGALRVVCGHVNG